MNNVLLKLGVALNFFVAGQNFLLMIATHNATHLVVLALTTGVGLYGLSQLTINTKLCKDSEGTNAN